MPFTSLLLALLTGLEQTGISKENRVKVALVPSDQDKDETMLLFKADKSAFHGAYLQKTQKCCDLVCFAYKLKMENDEKCKQCKQEIIICLIELKGGDKNQIEEASEQILQTYDGIQARIQEYKKVNIIWKARIISKSANPQQHGEKYRHLKKIIKDTDIERARETVNLTKIMHHRIIDD